MKHTFTSLSILLCSIAAYSQPGALDPLYGTGGKVLTNFQGRSQDVAYAMALQPDGKVVLAGATMVNNLYNHIALARYKHNGTLDSSFGENGKVINDLGGNAAVRSLAVQTDGKIIAAGYAPVGGANRFIVIRYNTDGRPDSTFDGDGKVAFDIYVFRVESVAVQGDGKIVFTGIRGHETNGNDVMVVRLNTNGTPDSTFNGTGIVATHVGSPSNNFFASALAIQADGRIVVAGQSGSGGVSDKFTLARYNSNGSLDATFNGTGIVVSAIGGGDIARAIAIQADGKIVVAGQTFNGVNQDYAVARYNLDGSLDSTFDGDGKLTTPIGVSDDIATGIAIQPDGKALVSGYTNDYNRTTGQITTERFSVIRYNVNGSLDLTFGDGGKVTTQVSTQVTNRAYGIALNSNRIYVGGTAITFNLSDFAMAAYQMNGSSLPLSLLNFSASLINSAVQCEWRTAREVNVDHFTVQRSLDGAMFRDVGLVSARNTSIGSYEFTDTLSAASRRAAILYFRLQTVEKDGKVTYSPVAVINLRQKVLVTISPNPARQVLRIEGRELQQVQLFDHAGKLVLLKALGENQVTNIGIAQLQRGAYTIVVTTNNRERSSRRIVLQ